MTAPAITMRIAMAQINPTVGAVDDNARLIVEYIHAARQRHAHVVVFPELSVCGYPPEDLLFHPRFVDRGRAALDGIASASTGILAVVGFVDRDAAGRLYNAAALLAEGKIAAVYHKVHLPNYGVFDEQRYFTPGGPPPIHRFGDRRPGNGNGAVLIGVSVCEDIWVADGPVRAQTAAGARLILNLNASPYHAGKREEREAMLAERARAGNAHICYVNQVGGQDELVFDGQSMVVGPDGRTLAHAGAFAEELLVADLSLPPAPAAPSPAAVQIASPPLEPLSDAVSPTLCAPLPRLEEVRQALLTGIRDYLGKNGFRQAVIGLSGGIDSALVAVLAAEALGPDNVTCIYMPSRYSADQSGADARELSARIGVTLHEIPIEGLFQGFLETLAPLFSGCPANEAEENLQSRVRGNLLMALSNKFGSMVLTTGNKSEMAVGYATLYGDMAGGFAVIKDLPKQMVYALSRHINSTEAAPPIPEAIIEREPTAELRADQKDSDSLPPYPILDAVLEAYVEQCRPVAEIVAMGFDADTVQRVVSLVDRAEYKRRQAPPGVRITPRAFGRDRRMPITQRFRE